MNTFQVEVRAVGASVHVNVVQGDTAQVIFDWMREQDIKANVLLNDLVVIDPDDANDHVLSPGDAVDLTPIITWGTVFGE